MGIVAVCNMLGLTHFLPHDYLWIHAATLLYTVYAQGAFSVTEASATAIRRQWQMQCPQVPHQLTRLL